MIRKAAFHVDEYSFDDLFDRYVYMMFENSHKTQRLTNFPFFGARSVKDPHTHRANLGFNYVHTLKIKQP